MKGGGGKYGDKGGGKKGKDGQHVKGFGKDGYKEWRHTFRTKAIGVDVKWGNIIDWIESEGNEEVTRGDYNGEMFDISYDETNSAMYDLIVSHTGGEARTAIRALREGEGLKAWRKLWEDYGTSTDREHSTELGRLSNPPQAKNAKELGQLMDRWVADVMRLNRESEEFKMSEGLMKTSLNM